MSESERVDTLNALEQAHRRYVAVLETCAALVERQAGLGDPLATFVLGQLHEAATAMKSESVAGHAFLAESQSSVS